MSSRIAISRRRGPPRPQISLALEKTVQSAVRTGLLSRHQASRITFADSQHKDAIDAVYNAVSSLNFEQSDVIDIEQPERDGQILQVATIKTQLSKTRSCSTTSLERILTVSHRVTKPSIGSLLKGAYSRRRCDRDGRRALSPYSQQGELFDADGPSVPRAVFPFRVFHLSECSELDFVGQRLSSAYTVSF